MSKDLKNLNSMIDKVKEVIYDIINHAINDSKSSSCSKIYRTIHWLPEGIGKVNLVHYIFDKCLIDIKAGVPRDIIIQNDIVKILRRIDFDFKFIISQDELDELNLKFLRICANDSCTIVKDIANAIDQVCDLNISVYPINQIFASKISGVYKACKYAKSVSSSEENIKWLLDEYNNIMYFGIAGVDLFGMPGMMGMNPMMGNPFFSEADRQTNIKVLRSLSDIVIYITNSMHTSNDAEKRALAKINGSISEAIGIFGRS